MITLLTYNFEFVDNLSPVLDRNGQIKEFNPQDSYANKDTTPLNKHGEGTFCRFSIHPKWSSVSGVYIFLIDGVLVYIGQCLDFAKRFNIGYGNISPRCCYIGGQSTNCKMNKVVLETVKANKIVSVYFHITPNYDFVERELIAYYKPIYNAALNSESVHVRQELQSKKINKQIERHITTSETSIPKSGSTNDICRHITQKLITAKEKGASECILVSGDIHREMGLLQKMPSVCIAMYKAMRLGDEILSTTPSGKSSTITIRYKT